MFKSYSNSFDEGGKQVFIVNDIAHLNTQQSDSELWNAFKGGSLTAFKSIYEQNIDVLVQYGNTVAPQVDLATDCVQDLFVDLWNKKSRLGAVSNIKGYLFISFRRKFLAMLKKQKKLLNSMDLEGLEIIVPNPVDDVFLTEEIKTSITASLNKLSRQKKEAIYLRFFNDLSCAEISEIMNIRTQSVYNLISSGLKIIKKSIVVILIICFHISL